VLASILFSSVRDLPSTTSASCVSASLVRLPHRYYTRYYTSVRLLAAVRTRITLSASRADPVDGKPRMPARSLGSRACSFPTCSWLSDYAGSARKIGLIVPLSVVFPYRVGIADCVFRSSIPGPSIPLSTLHPAPRGTQRKTRGQDSLLLSCLVGLFHPRLHAGLSRRLRLLTRAVLRCVAKALLFSTVFIIARMVRKSGGNSVLEFYARLGRWLPAAYATALPAMVSR
jgi:hypothetical protein